MKKILIIGASGSLASYVIRALEEQEDVELALFVRNQSRLSDLVVSKYKVVEGDAMDYNQVLSAVTGQDLVYVNLAGNLGDMAQNITNAMKEAGVKRIVAISSIGIYETPLKSVLKPYRALADVIEASGLEYTILRPDWFTSANEVDYQITYKGEPEIGSAISRKSIAAFVAEMVKDPEAYVNENLGISKP
ncbi:NAD(P)H-binding protein [Allomuricauda sp. NBRC 101325]|uniref:NAD(P)H-binding protein n=1 Tax=Allomuricauda sp. NBRC 101325 TaxID=1113758 RepID=UPI0024A160B6|nr:NAD(P)H-binding protein [Muricauda sp. NBRC 101325]GLU45139.1 NAD-dependent dehydratase [Muricauda sp. NBRC 101325]